MTITYKTRLSPYTVKCQKCGAEFDPRVQSAACHRKVRHFPVKRISEWQPPPNAAADKPKYKPKRHEGVPFQGDFRTLWDERQ